MKLLSLSLLVLLCGCTHCVLVVNLGIANKSAAAMAPLTPQAYCMALISSRVRYRSKPAPTLTQEQQDFCKEVIETEKVTGKGEKESK